MYINQMENLYSMARILYPAPCPESRDFPLLAQSTGEILGYEETDEHFRKRVLAVIEAGGGG